MLDKDKYRELLLRKKNDLAARVERTHKHIHKREEPVSPIFSEQSVEMESQQLIYFLDAEGKEELRDIDRALERLQGHTYGKCSACGEYIAEARLEAIPQTSRCIDCANQEG